ncbi:hypothetical protein HK096_006790, partial [Nowakowskiella sp. JEL0078]
MVEIKPAVLSASDPVYQAKFQEAKKASIAKTVNPKLIGKPLSSAVPEYTPATSNGSLDSFDKFNVTSKIGTEFKKESGIQLSKLTDEQVKELALL